LRGETGGLTKRGKGESEKTGTNLTKIIEGRKSQSRREAPAREGKKKEGIKGAGKKKSLRGMGVRVNEDVSVWESRASLCEISQKKTSCGGGGVSERAGTPGSEMEHSIPSIEGL